MAFFCGQAEEAAKSSEMFSFPTLFVALFDRVLAVIVAFFLLAWHAPGGEANIKNNKNGRFLWVARHGRACREHRKGQEVWSIGVLERAEKALRKPKHARQAARVQKSSFLEAKTAPKIDPGGIFFASGGALAR